MLLPGRNPLFEIKPLPRYSDTFVAYTRGALCLLSALGSALSSKYSYINLWFTGKFRVQHFTHYPSSDHHPPSPEAPPHRNPRFPKRTPRLPTSYPAVLLARITSNGVPPRLRLNPIAQDTKVSQPPYTNSRNAFLPARPPADKRKKEEKLAQATHPPPTD
jgi:hypothetical protein